MNEKQKKENEYSPRGFDRAVPLLLGALAIFLALCYITQNTGVFGRAISHFMCGLFSWAAYAVPAVFLIHAIFYRSDRMRRRALTRVIFSVLTVLTLAVLAYLITNWNAEVGFEPRAFYREGKESLAGGGFLGGIFAYGLMKLIGKVGTILFITLVFGLYIVYFFAEAHGAPKRFMLGVLAGIATFFAGIESAIKGSKKKREEGKVKKAEKRETERRAELSDDEFFAADTGMKKLEIEELGILEERDEEAVESNPTLQEKVSPKSESGEEEPREARHRTIFSDYDATETEERPADIVIDAPEEPAPAPADTAKDANAADGVFAAPEKKAPARESFGTDERADDVFTEDFDPFDLATNEKLASKPSSHAAEIRARKVEEEKEEPESLSNITAEDVERARRNADFEMKKKALLRARGIDPDAAEAQKEAELFEAAEETEAPASPESTVFTENEPIAPVAETPVWEEPVQAAEEKPEVEPETVYTMPSEDASERISSFQIHRSEDFGADVRQNYYSGVIDKRVEEPEPEPAPIPEARDESTNAYRRAAAFAAAIEENPAPTPAPVQAAPVQPAQPAPAKPKAEEPLYIRPDPQYIPPKPTYGEPVRPAAEAAPATPRVSYYEAPKNEAPVYEEPKAEEPVYEEPKTEEPAFVPETPKAEEPVRETYLASPMAEPEPEIYAPVEEAEERKEILPADEPFPAEEAAAPEEENETAFGTVRDTEPEPIDVLKIHREAVEDAAEEEPEEAESAEEEIEEDDELSEEELGHGLVFEEGEPEEEAPSTEEIPEEEQNPDIAKQQQMFAMFDRTREAEDERIEAEPTEDAAEEEPEETAEAPKAPLIEEFVDDSTIPERDHPAEPEAEEDEDKPPFDVEEKPARPAKPEAPAKPERKIPDYSHYKFPPLDLLAVGKQIDDAALEEETQENGDLLIGTLADFNVTASIKSIDRGPRITRFEVVPAKGVRVSAVTGLFNDIALALAVEGIRMEAPIPGKSAIGFEIPNRTSVNVCLRDLIEADEFQSAQSKTTICVGKDVTGMPVFGDIAKMPHLLIAGATGMGKSVCMNAFLISMLYKARPEELKLIMIDPKKVEFKGYNGIPHLLIPVVTEAKQAAGALAWACEQMEKRYDLIEQLSVRNIAAYNEKVAADPSLGEPMPRIIIVIDELNDLMIKVRDPVENLIMSIAQKARAAGIHLIIGTQRPSVNVITGTIKSNINSRIACKVSSAIDSRTILDQSGAEKLLDKGDMLYFPVGKPKPLRVQGAFVSDAEVEAIMEFLKSQANGDIYDEQALEDINRAAQKCDKSKKGADADDGDDGNENEGVGYLNDQKFLDCVELAINQGKISTSLLQRKIQIGYGRAAKFIDIMEDLGIVSEPNGQKPRDVLITIDEWHEKLARLSLDDD